MDVVVSLLNGIWIAYLVFCFIFTTFFMGKFFAIRKVLAGKAKLTSIKLVSVEEVDGLLMMYDGVNHMFICQAVTEDELWTTAKNLFPSKELLLK